MASMNRDEPQDEAVGRIDRLLAAVADNQDRAAFHEVFEHFAPRLKAFILRQGSNPQLAEEVVQETMVNVWRKAGQFDPSKASASTWVFTIARNLRIDHLRKANRPEPDMNDPALAPDPEPHALEHISRRQAESRMRKALAGLPSEQQDVLQAVFFEDKPHAQAAAELDIPLGTVKSRIRLALKRIRLELGDEQ